MGRVSFCFLQHSESSVSEFNIFLGFSAFILEATLNLISLNMKKKVLKKGMSTCHLTRMKVKAWSRMNGKTNGPLTHGKGKKLFQSNQIKAIYAQ